MASPDKADCFSALPHFSSLLSGRQVRQLLSSAHRGQHSFWEWSAHSFLLLYWQVKLSAREKLLPQGYKSCVSRLFDKLSLQLFEQNTVSKPAAMRTRFHQKAAPLGVKKPRKLGIIIIIWGQLRYTKTEVPTQSSKLLLELTTSSKSDSTKAFIPYCDIYETPKFRTSP